MSFLSNAHTHTLYCDGKNTPEEMLEAADGLGFVSLGFSGHASQGFDSAYAMDGGRQEAYHKDLRALQERQLKGGGKARIWVGLEQDALVSQERKRKNRADFDYILGSTHYACRDFHGKCVAVDGDVDLLRAYVQEAYAGDMLAMVKAYFDTHVHMLLEDKPDIIGHFDLVRKNGFLYHIFDPEGAAYRKMALAALEAAQESGSVLEVNMGGMARGFASEPFPSRELLLVWREMGGQVTMTSDCHDAVYLDAGFEGGMKALKALGYQSVLRLGTGSGLWEAVACE